LKEIIVQGALFSVVVIVLRLVWVYPGAWMSSQVRRHLHLRTVETFSPSAIFILGWSGMRGVLALAAAISLPETLNNGAPFPQRNLIIFLTFCVIFATLVLQGLSLPALIRRLGLSGFSGIRGEEELARREMITAALESLDRLRQESGRERAEIHDQLERYYRRRLALLEERLAKDGRPMKEHVEHQDSLAQQLRKVEREIALKLRDENKIHDEVLRSLERELDLLDARFAESEY